MQFTRAGEQLVDYELVLRFAETDYDLAPERRDSAELAWTTKRDARFERAAMSSGAQVSLGRSLCRGSAKLRHRGSVPARQSVIRLASRVYQQTEPRREAAA